MQPADDSDTAIISYLCQQMFVSAEIVVDLGVQGQSAKVVDFERVESKYSNTTMDK